MSYCVHCGVKLEESLTKCPLCNTPVIDPNELKKLMPSPPFPVEKGETEKIKSKDFVMLLTIALATTAFCCGALNYFVFSKTAWSLLIIGICAVIWIAIVPNMLFKKMPIYISLFLDGIAAVMYLYFISFITPTNFWFYGLGVPITFLITCILLIFAFLMRNISSSLMHSALYVYILVPLLCIGIELIICMYYDHPLKIVWSAIVTVPCIVVDIILITILSKKRLREAVRRRLHF